MSGTLPAWRPPLCIAESKAAGSSCPLANKHLKRPPTHCCLSPLPSPQGRPAPPHADHLLQGTAQAAGLPDPERPHAGGPDRGVRQRHQQRVRAWGRVGVGRIGAHGERGVVRANLQQKCRQVHNPAPPAAAAASLLVSIPCCFHLQGGADHRHRVAGRGGGGEPAGG